MKTAAGILASAMIAILFLASACAPKQARSATPDRPIVENIDTDKASALIIRNATNVFFVILDVRTPAEFSDGHIANAVNLNIGSADFAAELDKLDRSRLYLVYCRSGSRSARAMEIMREMGFYNIRNLFGGIVDWERTGLPVVK